MKLTTTDPRVWEFWGKADPKRKNLGPEWHPLLCHILDVVACTEILLTEIYPRRLKVFARILGIPEPDALAWILFAIALHDLGKATPPFQAKVDFRKESLATLGLDFPNASAPHGELSALLVREALKKFGCPTSLASGLARAVGAHHGQFADLNHLLNIEDSLGREAGRSPLWGELRSNLIDTLATIIGVNTVNAPGVPASTPEKHGFYADLAGLTTVADWVGSNADIFMYINPPESPEAYRETARQRATEAMAAAGFRRPPIPSSRSFQQLFNRPPWPMHQAMERVVNDIESGSLVIVEAPMGEGKTEAALLLYDTLAARGAEGLYFALPTQATSNQILRRVEDYLSKSFPGETHGLHLVHGDAGLSERYQELKQRAYQHPPFSVTSVGDIAHKDTDQGPVADAWFAKSKRTLLAPIAVGTIDQALLGVLRAKFHFLRLHGLARKVIVMDEVHAYDEFTSVILADLCAWLRSMGTTVVLLSATLATHQRNRLLEVYDAPSIDTAATSYPRISIVKNGAVRVESFKPHCLTVSIHLKWYTDDEIPRLLAAVLSDGGCAVWIVNTVARAQSLFVRLSTMQQTGELHRDIELSLLHARFPFSERQARELACEAAFGPPDKATARPHAAILIGTQVLEQSLDFDFDLMVTDLAPVDLVLQRAGRLHRHERGARPTSLAERQLWIVCPENSNTDEGPAFGANCYVYDEAILLRSWLALESKLSLTIPDDIQPLVEQVYSHVPSMPTGALRERLARLDNAHLNESIGKSTNAERRSLPNPEESDPFRSFTVHAADDEDPRIHEELRAITRLGDQAVAVIPVIHHSNQLILWGQQNNTLHINPAIAELPFPDILKIARQTLSISRRNVVRALINEVPPKAFQRSGHLRHHRLLRLDESGTTTVGGTTLRLDPSLGLVVGELSPNAEPS